MLDPFASVKVSTEFLYRNLPHLAFASRTEAIGIFGNDVIMFCESACSGTQLTDSVYSVLQVKYEQYVLTPQADGYWRYELSDDPNATPLAQEIGQQLGKP